MTQPRMAFVPQIRMIKAPEGGIGKRIGNELEGQECEIVLVDLRDEQLVDISISPEKIMVFNLQTVAVLTSGERLGFAALYDDLWFAVVDDCSDSGTG